MTKEFIPVNEPLLAGNEKKYLEECIDTGWISSEGPFVSKFENYFSEVVGRKSSVAVCNGSAALDVAIAALKIGAGDEVIMPTFTIISCAAAIYRAGATPILVDCEPDTWNMNVWEIESLITEQTKAIMAVHIYGLPVDMNPLMALAKKYNISVIEDAAQAIGLEYEEKPCGGFGDVSVFSFYPNKHITTGEGGMVSVNDPILAERCSSLRNLCFVNSERFVHYELGWNYRMTNLQAAVGLAQLEQLPTHLKLKRSIGLWYLEALKEIDELELPLERTDYADNLFWVFGIVLKDSFPIDARGFMSRLGEKGVGTRPFFYPMHQQPIFNREGLFIGDSHPVSERLYKRGLYLPSGLALKESDVKKVVNAVKQVLISAK